MCVAGGKRCEYADSVANVRRKTRSKLKGSYDIEREVVKAVETFKEQNPALVLAHLPEKTSFQYQPPKRPIPEHIKTLLDPMSIPARGSAEDRNVLFGNLYERGREWREGLTREEDNAVQQYTMSAFESMNTYLRRHGFRDWAKQNAFLWGHDESAQDYKCGKTPSSGVRLRAKKGPRARRARKTVPLLPRTIRSDSRAVYS